MIWFYGKPWTNRDNQHTYQLGNLGKLPRLLTCMVKCYNTNKHEMKQGRANVKGRYEGGGSIWLRTCHAGVQDQICSFFRGWKGGRRRRRKAKESHGDSQDWTAAKNRKPNNSVSAPLHRTLWKEKRKQAASRFKISVLWPPHLTCNLKLYSLDTGLEYPLLFVGSRHMQWQWQQGATQSSDSWCISFSEN